MLGDNQAMVDYVINMQLQLLQYYEIQWSLGREVDANVNINIAEHSLSTLV